MELQELFVNVSREVAALTEKATILSPTRFDSDQSIGMIEAEIGAMEERLKKDKRA